MKPRAILFGFALLFVAITFMVVWLLRRTDPTADKSVGWIEQQSSSTAPAQLDSGDIQYGTEGLPPSRATHLADTSVSVEIDAAHALGRITGVVHATIDSPFPIISGIARIDAAPPIQALPRDTAEQRGVFDSRPTVEIDEHGCFAFENVPLGEWVVRVDPDGFEKREQRVTLTAQAPEANLEFLTRLIRPLQLVIALFDETGAPFFESMSDADRKKSLIPDLNLISSCPEIGARRVQDAGGSSAKVQTTSRSDPWATVTLAESETGCACVMFDSLVLAASPYSARQGRVEIRLARSEMAKLLRTIEVLVVDANTRVGLANATVRFSGFRGSRSETTTDRNGWARREDVLVGSLTLRVEREGYSSVTLYPDAVSDGPITVELVRSVTLSGRLYIVDGKSARLPIALLPWGKGKEQSTHVFTQEDGTFSISDLHAGEYLLGLSTIESPSWKRVRAGKVPGWIYVDARLGNVQGIFVDVTEELVLRSGFVLPGADPNLVDRLKRERSK